MRFPLRIALTAIAALAVSSAARADLLFSFQLDDTFEYPSPGVLTSSFGSGSIRLGTDPGNGTFTLADVGSFTASFTFPSLSTTFTEADLTTNPADLQLILSNYGTVRRLQITGDPALSVGPFGGSPSFSNGSFFLDFEPIDPTGPNNFDAFVVGDGRGGSVGGTYLGTSAPEPSSIALLALGAAGALAIRRRKRDAA